MSFFLLSSPITLLSMSLSPLSFQMEFSEAATYEEVFQETRGGKHQQ